MEYSLNNGESWIPCTDNMSLEDFGWNGRRKVSVSFRYPAAGGKFASDAFNLILEALPGMEVSTISGRVNCSSGNGTGVRIQLLDSAEEILYTVTADGEAYELQDVKQGSYILRVSKSNYVQRDYPIAVSDQDMDLDVEIWIAGDVNGDGKVNVMDNLAIYNHINGTKPLAGYEFLVGDVEQDNKINVMDNIRIYNHIAGNRLLW